MNFIERFKFYLIGLIAGIFFVILIFGRRSSCKNMITNYAPNGRVLLEMKSKPFYYSENAMITLNSEKIDTTTFKEAILPELDIDFDLSEQRARPCGKYIAYYNDSIIHWKLNLEKCKDQVKVNTIQDYTPAP